MAKAFLNKITALKRDPEAGPVGTYDPKLLRFNRFQLGARGFQFIITLIVFAIFSYFTISLNINKDHFNFSNNVKAVEGISGIALLYLIIVGYAVALIARHKVPSAITLFLDAAFVGCFIFVAAANSGGTFSCTGEVEWHYGKGNATEKIEPSSSSVPATFGTVCRLNSAVIMLSILNILLFVASVSITVLSHRLLYKDRRDSYLQGKETLSSESNPPSDSLAGHTQEQDTVQRTPSNRFAFWRVGSTRVAANHQEALLPPQADPDQLEPRPASPVAVSPSPAAPAAVMTAARERQVERVQSQPLQASNNNFEYQPARAFSFEDVRLDADTEPVSPIEETDSEYYHRITTQSGVPANANRPMPPLPVESTLALPYTGQDSQLSNNSQATRHSYSYHQPEPRRSLNVLNEQSNHPYYRQGTQMSLTQEQFTPHQVYTAEPQPYLPNQEYEAQPHSATQQQYTNSQPLLDQQRHSTSPAWGEQFPLPMPMPRRSTHDFQ